jgi:hypothetical protein
VQEAAARGGDGAHTCNVTLIIADGVLTADQILIADCAAVAQFPRHSNATAALLRRVCVRVLDDEDLRRSSCGSAAVKPG